MILPWRWRQSRVVNSDITKTKVGTAKMEEAEKKYIHAVSILEQATDLEKHENVDIVFANGSETLPCIGMISDFSVLLSNLCIYDQFFFSSCFNI